MKNAWVVVLVAVMSVAACITRQQAKSALDVAQALCVIANATLDVPAIQSVCGVADDLVPSIKKAIDDFQVEQAKASARASVSRDAGTDAHK